MTKASLRPSHPMIPPELIKRYQQHGAVMIKGLFKPYLAKLRAGVAQNMQQPGPYAAENLQKGEPGRFFDDYCNWQRINPLGEVCTAADIALAAAALMQSNQVQLFHDHVLVKEAGTNKATPWHQDAPYYFVDGMQTVSFWVPLDPVTDSTLRCIAGSHLWPKPVLPTRWLANDNFYPHPEDYLPVPDPDAAPDEYQILEWPMQAGDAVAFHFKTLHGARGNHSKNTRRAFSVRLLGDDARFVERPGRTSPPFPDHGMTAGQQLRTDWFPILELG